MAHNFVTKEPTVAVFISGEFFWPSDCFSFAALKKKRILWLESLSGPRPTHCWGHEITLRHSSGRL